MTNLKMIISLRMLKKSLRVNVFFNTTLPDILISIIISNFISSSKSEKLKTLAGNFKG